MNPEEINEKVASKLGWTEIENRSNLGFGIKWTGIRPGKRGYPKRCKGFDSLPDYCRDIKAAWEIVEWVVNKNNCFITIHGDGKNKFSCEIDMGPDGLSMELNSAPMAICKAFLELEK